MNTRGIIIIFCRNKQQSSDGCVLRLLNRTDCYVWIRGKSLWLFPCSCLKCTWSEA